MSVLGQRTILYLFSRGSLRAAILLVGLTIGLHITTVQAEEPPALLSPILTAPATGSWSKSSSQSFTWNPVETADAYTLRYVKAPTCSEESFIAPETTTTTVIEPTKSIEGLGDGMWCWQVRAVQHENNETKLSPWSQVWSVSVDTVAPVVTVAEPHTGPEFKGIVTTSDVTLSVLINGNVRSDIPVTLSSTPNEVGTYNWHLSIPELETGSYILGVKAVDAAGNEMVGYADFQVASASKKHGINPAFTEAATLPLVEMGPLVFIAPPLPTALAEPTSVVPYTTAQTASRLITPAQIAKPEETVKTANVSDGAIQASGEGWKVFGIAWYWWAAGIFGLSLLVWRIRSLIVSTSASSLNEPRTVY